jgi:isopentenyl diphosphate isomerase/L-lactate dehydrogenase-like FMN-dependent dehydrogenase
MVDVSRVDASVELLGERLAFPVALAPAALQRLAHPEGELAAVRAAARFGAGYVLSVGASTSLEEVAEAGRGAVLWFQIYLWDARSWTERLLARAREAGYVALCVTVDSKAPGGRKYRDLRNGMASGPKIDLRSSLSAMRRPAWLRGYLTGPPIRAVHLGEDDRKLGISLFKTPSVIQRRMSPSATWEEISWLRRLWEGPLVVKGILNPDDADEAFRRGADAIVCSNHGGRVIDGVPPTLLALPRLAEVARRHGREVLFDGGIRTGGDLVKGLALGASAGLVTRPFWWGLAVGGQAGVEAVLEILRAELDSTLTMMGRRTPAELDGSGVEPLAQPFPAATGRS